MAKIKTDVTTPPPAPSASAKPSTPKTTSGGAIPPPPTPTATGQTTTSVNADSKVFLGSSPIYKKGRGELIPGETPQFKSVSQLQNYYSLLTADQKTMLAAKLISLGQKPTESAMRSLWNNVVSTAAQIYADDNSKRVTPWDTLNAIVPATGMQAYGTTAKETPPQVQHIDLNSAKQILNKVAMDQGFTGKFTASDYNTFMKEYNAKAAYLPQTYKKVNGVMQMQPSMFSGTDFANNWLWAHSNITDKTAKGAALNNITMLTQIAKNNGLIKSPAEIQAAAKDIAVGGKSLEDFKIAWGNEAVDPITGGQYQMLANRMSSAPGATVRDLLSPYINQVASVLEVDPNEIDIHDNLIKQALGTGVVDGKNTSMSLYDVKLAAMNDPRWQKTQAANTVARDAAVGLARAFGFGV